MRGRERERGRGREREAEAACVFVCSRVAAALPARRLHKQRVVSVNAENALSRSLSIILSASASACTSVLCSALRSHCVAHENERRSSTLTVKFICCRRRLRRRLLPRQRDCGAFAIYERKLFLLALLLLSFLLLLLLLWLLLLLGYTSLQFVEHSNILRMRA